MCKTSPSTQLLIGVFTILILFLMPNFAQAKGRLIILGVDSSGSYNLRKMNIQFIKWIIVKIFRPGDTLYVRRITDESYPDYEKNMIFQRAITLPQLGKAPGNIFDPMAQQRYINKKAGIIRKKKRLLASLNSVKPINSPKTDIYGFLSACADRLSNTQGYEDKIILIASDMQDNCKRFNEINLAGARVLIIAFQKDKDPAKTRRLQAFWKKTLLKEMNASSVAFLSLDQDIKSIINQP